MLGADFANAGPRSVEVHRTDASDRASTHRALQTGGIVGQGGGRGGGGGGGVGGVGSR